MPKSNTVQEYVAALPEALREVGEKMVPIIEGVLPGRSAIWHAHPVWSLGDAPGKDPVCLLKGYSSYVTFGVWLGREIDDPSGRMDTSGGLAHVKLRGVDDIDAELFTDWLTQAVAKTDKS